MFNFTLPKHLIAQRPLRSRDSCRLLVIHSNGKIEHRKFYNIVDYVEKGDTLVLNNSKVVHASIKGRKPTGGRVNILLLKRIKDSLWSCVLKGKNIKPGLGIIVNDLECTVVKKDGRTYVVDIPDECISRYSSLPIPPYIKGDIEDPESYQTVYARINGSIAAPTAGLHFTENLLQKIRGKGVSIVYITLHIGAGSFVHGLDNSEYYEICEETAKTINKTLDNGHRLIVVGTSTVKCLESSCRDGMILASSGDTNLLIKPGYKFKLPIGGLVTNFHLPNSTMLMLICAYRGTETIMNAYRIGIQESYRFYSFGDAMLIFHE